MTALVEIPTPSCETEDSEETFPAEFLPTPTLAAPPKRRVKRLSWDQFLLSQIPLTAALALIIALVGFAMVRTLPAGARGPGQVTSAQAAAAPSIITSFSSDAVAQKVAVSADASGALKWDRASYEATAGDVTFVVSNPSPLTHNFRIEGPGCRRRVPFAGKTTQSFTIKGLQPGEYADRLHLRGTPRGGHGRQADSEVKRSQRTTTLTASAPPVLHWTGGALASSTSPRSAGHFSRAGARFHRFVGAGDLSARQGLRRAGRRDFTTCRRCRRSAIAPGARPPTAGPAR
ncbi:MAG: hypothetical protein U0841_00785 [Chloroflexia bacterium]